MLGFDKKGGFGGEDPHPRRGDWGAAKDDWRWRWKISGSSGGGNVGS